MINFLQPDISPMYVSATLMHIVRYSKSKGKDLKGSEIWCSEIEAKISGQGNALAKL